jgi:acetate kinase
MEFAGVYEARLPQHLAGARIRVEGIDAIVFRGDINNVVSSLPRDRHIGNVEWLCVNLTVDGAAK